MANPPAVETAEQVARAKRASARALADCHTWARAIEPFQREGDTASAARLYPHLCRAQRRYQRAQATLAANPLRAEG